MESYLESEGLTAKTDKLRQMMTEHPDWPVIFMAGENAYFNEHFLYNPCAELIVEEGEVLDHELPSSEFFENVSFYTDRRQFHDDMMEYLSDEWDECGFDYSTEHQQRYTENYDKAREDDIAEYDRYWRPCIIVKVDN